MNYIRIPTLVFCLCMSVAASAQGGPKNLAAYTEMLEASDFVQNYKQMASVSAVVFAARDQGSDKQFAALMAKIAKADLTDFELCISKAYAAGPLTVGDAEELTKLFRSPAGQLVLHLSQQMLVADLRRGYHKPFDSSSFTELDRQRIASLYKEPVFQRYGAFITSPAYKGAIQTCIASSQVGRESGIKF